jgi:phenylpyruvate tautomerase PptA (4-oxalocrotonate tautomerase family)
MPTYFCTTVERRLTAEQKSRIAGEITRIHCEVTRAPSFFAQVIFQEVKHGNYLMGGAPLKHDAGSGGRAGLDGCASRVGSGVHAVHRKIAVSRSRVRHFDSFEMGEGSNGRGSD